MAVIFYRVAYPGMWHTGGNLTLTRPYTKCYKDSKGVIHYEDEHRCGVVPFTKYTGSNGVGTALQSFVKMADRGYVGTGSTRSCNDIVYNGESYGELYNKGNNQIIPYNNGVFNSFCVEYTGDFADTNSAGTVVGDPHICVNGYTNNGKPLECATYTDTNILRTSAGNVNNTITYQAERCRQTLSNENSSAITLNTPTIGSRSGRNCVVADQEATNSDNASYGLRGLHKTGDGRVECSMGYNCQFVDKEGFVVLNVDRGKWAELEIDSGNIYGDSAVEVITFRSNVVGHGWEGFHAMYDLKAYVLDGNNNRVSNEISDHNHPSSQYNRTWSFNIGNYSGNLRIRFECNSDNFDVGLEIAKLKKGNGFKLKRINTDGSVIQSWDGQGFTTYEDGHSWQIYFKTKKMTNINILEDDGRFIYIDKINGRDLYLADTVYPTVSCMPLLKVKDRGSLSDKAYRYLVRYRGTSPNVADWDGNLYYSDNIQVRDGKRWPARCFKFDRMDKPSGTFVADNGDIISVCDGRNDVLPSQTVTKYYNQVEYTARVYRWNNTDTPVLSGTVKVKANGAVDISGFKPGSLEHTTPYGWGIWRKVDWPDDEPYPLVDPYYAVNSLDKSALQNITLASMDAKILPLLRGQEITISLYKVVSIDTTTGQEKYSDAPVQVKGYAGFPTELPYPPGDLGVGYEFYKPVGWFSKKYGGGQYIALNESGGHTFYGNATLYGHYVIDTIDGIEWGLCTKDDEGKWTWNEPGNFAGKTNVFFVGNDVSWDEEQGKWIHTPQEINVGVRVYPNSTDKYGTIINVVQSNGMFTVNEISNAISGKELYFNVTPSDSLMPSTIDYMVLTAYTNVGMKSMACVFFVERVDITLNTEVTNGNGDTVSSKPEDPITDHTDNGLTAYFKSHIKGGRAPAEGDTIDDYGTPYHSIWIYHSVAVRDGVGDRNWIYCGSATRTFTTNLGKLSELPTPRKRGISNGRVIEYIFKGWCDIKGDMVDKDTVYLKSTSVYASWIRPEDFVDTDMMVLQRPISKGSYSRMIQLKLSIPTAMTLAYSPSVTQTAVPTQMANNAFVFDKGVSQSITLSFTRVSPADYDDSSDDSDKWSNFKWMSELIAMQNRYQVDTDGQKFLYIPMDCGLRRYKVTGLSKITTGSLYRYTHYGYRYPLVGRCTDAPKFSVNSIGDLPTTGVNDGDIAYVSSLDKMMIYSKTDDDAFVWHLLMGHEQKSKNWNTGFLYTNAYGEKHYYLGRNVYIKKITPSYEYGTPDSISFTVNLVVGGLEENMSDVIEW